MQWLELLGLVGVTSVIVNGSIFDPYKQWAMGFEKRYNIFRLSAELTSCMLCTGMWVGMLWAAIHGAAIERVFLMGGLVSILSDATNLVLAVVSGVAQRAGHEHSSEKSERARALLKMLVESRMNRADDEEEVGDGGESLEG